MKKTLLFFVLTAFSLNGQTPALHINGGFHINDGAVVSVNLPFNINNSATNVSCDGHLIIAQGITGENRLSMQSNAHLDLRGNTLYTFGDNTVFKHLSLSNSSNVDIVAGKHLSLSGNITNASTNAITLKATGSGNYAQLKFDGSYTGAGNVVHEQHLHGGWVMMGASMNATTAALFGDVGSSGSTHTSNTQNLFSWNGEHYVNVANNAAAITPGVGYFGFVGTFGFRGSDGVHAFTGKPNTSATPALVNLTADQSVAIEGTHTNEREGWNLIANPFTCALDFAGLTKTNVGNAFYIYDNNKSGGPAYDIWSAAGITDPYIAPMQSFWVKADGNGAPSLGTIAMATHGTVSSAPAHLRTAPFDRLVLRTHPTADTSTTDYTVVSFIDDNTTMGYDGAWDAIKMANTALNIYSTHNNGDVMAINAIPYGPNYSDKQTVPISFKAVQHGDNYTIRYDDTFMINTYAVYLEDKLEKSFTDLTGQDYTFINDTSITNRFVLHFRAGALSIDAPDALKSNSGVNAWVFENHAYLNAQFDGPAQLTLYDLTGKQLQSERMSLSKGVRSELPLRSDLAAGVYLLRIETAAGNETIKFTR